MDELYGNAWGDSADQPTAPQVLKLSRSDSWTSPKLGSLTVHDDEADLAAPSWSNQAGIQWDEPPSAPGFSWSQADADGGWGASTYEGIEIKSTPRTQTDEPLQAVSTDGETPSPTAEEPQVDEEEVSISQDSSSVPGTPVTSRLPALPVSPPVDGDGFGIFESALSPTAADVVSSVAFDSGEGLDAWGSPWAGGHPQDEPRGDENMDEWEAARKQKEMRDRRVPPEVVESILQQCNDFCKEAYPHDEKTEGTPEEGSWRDDWRSGLESVKGLEAVMQAFLPPLALEPTAAFGKTNVAKKMASSVKLTRNLPLTRDSPMARYLAARGSLAWEVAVKGSTDPVEEDVVPVGWRIIEKEPSTASTSTMDAQKQPSRFFSFWSRRQSGISPARTPSERSRSPSDSLNERPSHSRQGSQDSVKASSRLSVDRTSPTVPREQSASPTSINSPPLVNFPPSATSPPSATAAQPPSYADAPELQAEQSQAAPSAVSRFLNRFSRRSSAHNGRSSHSSLALSSDDLEFLSDMPSASDPDEDTVSLSSLVSTLKSEPLPPILPPPPPTPLRVSPAVSPTASAKSQSPANVSPAALNTANELSSLDSFFAPLESTAPASSIGAPALQPARNVIPTLTYPLGLSRPLSPAGTSPTAAKPAQLFYLPSPPSSRSQTPVVAPPAANTSAMSAAGLRVNTSRATDAATQPTRPASSASTSSQSSGTPLSAKPLGDLYPGAARVSSPPRALAAPAGTTNAIASFMIPPPSAVRSHSPAFFNVPILAPPPRASPKSPTALSSKPHGPIVNIMDDDGFSDFQTSPAATFPPPSQSTQASSSRQHSPPALSLSSVQSSAPLFDDDDFSDFHSSLTHSTSLQPTAAQSFGSASGLTSSSSDTAFLTPRKASASGFSLTSDNSPILPSPSPPRVPSKQPTPARLHPAPIPPGSSKHARTRSKAEEEKHTMQLMERAAARTGRWPAPASPLPETLSFLPPPPPSISTNKALVDLMGDDGDAAGSTALPMSTSVSLPTALDGAPLVPMSSMSQSQSLQGFGAAQKPAAPPPGMSTDLFSRWPAPAPAPSATKPQAGGKKTGGLSAQDLSFFEGL